MSAFDVAWSPVRTGKVVKLAEAKEECRIVIDLHDFQNQGLLDFGSVATLEEGSNAYTGVVELRNASGSRDITVSLDRFSSKNGFSIQNAETCWFVGQGCSEQIHVKWFPRAAGGVRQSITLNFLNESRRKVRVGAFVCGVARVSGDKKKKPRRTLSKQRDSDAENKDPLDGALVVDPRSETSSSAPLKLINNVEKKKKTGAIKKTMKVVSKTLRLRNPEKDRQVAVMKASRKELKMKQVLYDERWVEKQERGFSAWINYLVDPDNGNNEIDELNPFASLAQKQRKASILRKAYMIYNSSEMQHIAFLLDKEIANRGITIRNDKDLYKDLGLRKLVLDLLFRYNQSWLVLGLEMVLGMPISPKGLRKTTANYFLGDPELDETYRDTRKGLFDENPEYKSELKRRTLRRFLMLVLFLDRAKAASLIDHPACLFHCDSKIKSSKEMIIAFSKEFLSGEGNVIKHLLHSCEYVVDQQQTPLDEFDFKVSNLATDLRDGLRLTRSVELLTNNKDRSLSKLMRVPAVSRLQKLHNVGVALKELEAQGVDLGTSSTGNSFHKMSSVEMITNKDLVDGHRQKTLSLLWKMITKWKLSVIIPQDVLRDEINRVRCLHGETATQILQHSQVDIPEEYDQVTRLLLQWCQVVCAHHGLRLSNFTTSMASGRALCLLVHHYHPKLLPREGILKTTIEMSNTSDPDLDWAPFDLQNMSRAEYRVGLSGEQANFKLVNDCANALGCVPVLLPPFDSENIPEQKLMVLFVSYLCSRLLASRDEIAAATRIQRVWIRRRNTQRFLSLGLKGEKVALTLQCAFRAFVARKMLSRLKATKVLQSFARMVPPRNNWLRFRCAVVSLQAISRARTVADIFQLCRVMIIGVQSCVRRHQACRIASALRYQRSQAVRIQAQFRGYQARAQFQSKINATIQIQSIIRMKQSSVKVQHELDQIVLIQSHVRRRLVSKNQHRLGCLAIKVQTCFRVHRDVHRYQSFLFSIRKLQAYARRNIARKDYLLARRQIIVVQSLARSRADRAGYQHIISQIMRVQSFARTTLAVDKYRRIRNGFVMFQSVVRMHQQQSLFYTVAGSCLIVQAFARGCIAKSHYLSSKADITKIQASFRMCIWKMRYNKARRAVTSIQALARMSRDQTQFGVIRGSIIKIQATARMFLCKRRNFSCVFAAVKIQAWARANIYQTKFLVLRERVTVLQSIVRMRQRLHIWENTVKSAVMIQSIVRQDLIRSRYIYIQQCVCIIQSLERRRSCSKSFQFAIFQCTKLQAFGRGVIARANLLRVKRATIVVQSFSRGVLARSMCQSRNTAATKLASLVRMKLDRNYFVQTRQFAVRIQATWRMGLHSKALARTVGQICMLQSQMRKYLCQQRYKGFVQAVVRIQSLARTRIATVRWETEKAAAVCLQTSARTLLCKLTYRHILGCTIFIQAQWRQRLVKNKMYRMNNASCVIQAMVRMHATNSTFLCYKQSITKLQAAIRARNLSRRFSKVRTQISLLQAHARGVLQRRRYEDILRKVCTVQSRFRTVLARKQFVHIIANVVKLQANIRMLHIRTKFRDTMDCVIQLQASLRGVMARQAIRDSHIAATKLQAFVKKTLVMQRYQIARSKVIRVQSFVRKHAAQQYYCSVLAGAVKVQSVFRRCATRIYVSVLVRKATLIQSIVRMFQARQQYKRYMYCAVQMQTFARSFLAQHRYSRVLASVQTMQAISRTFLVRSRISKLHVSAIRIERVIRGGICRTRLAREHHLATMVQSAWRSYAIQKWFVNQRSHIGRLQGLARGFLSRRRWENSTKYMIILQAHIRGRFCYHRYIQLKRATVVLQAVMRRKIAQDLCKRTLLAVTKMQSLLRKHLVCLQVTRCHEAAVLLQKQIRLWQFRIYMKRCHEASTKTQAIWRGYISRQQYQNTLANIIRVQSAFRGFMVRARFEYCMNCIVVVQSLVRRRPVLLDYQHVIQSTLIIQTFARNYCISDLALQQTIARFQAIIRGNNVRKLRSQEMKIVEKRLAAASKNATPELTLGYRTRSALDWLLRSKNLASVLKACSTLDVCTSVSRECSESFLDSDASDVLFALIRSCNRSEPHQRVLQVALTVLNRVAKDDSQTEYQRVFAAASTCAVSLVDLLQIFRDKPKIFSRALKLLEYFAKREERANTYIKSDHDVCKRLVTIEQILRRKCDIHRQHQTGRHSETAKRFDRKNISEKHLHHRLQGLLENMQLI